MDRGTKLDWNKNIRNKHFEMMQGFPRFLVAVLLLMAVEQASCSSIVNWMVGQEGEPSDSNSSSASSSSSTSLSSDRPFLRNVGSRGYESGGANRYNQNITADWFRRHSAEFLAREKVERKRRMRERRKLARERLQRMPPPPREQLTRMSAEEVQRAEELHLERLEKKTGTAEMKGKKERRTSWIGGSSSGGETFSETYLADTAEEYDMWAQAFRMLGGYIDCDHWKDNEEHSGDRNNGNQQNDEAACSRWMVWAAYVNPNYQGYEYDEYYGDEPYSALDCHEPETEWQLLGVYRQEFYQFIEQISKHLWAIDEYEYVVALAGLAYMTDYDCFQVGYDNSGNTIYAGVAPQPYGKFEMALYTDSYCLIPDTSLGKTFDDFGMTSDIDLGSKDATDDDGKSWAYDWWYDTQEYTLTQLNEVYEEFKYCTSCVDYPTYQDGYFIGDYGTDEDDLINQCWKFYSHDSFTCETDCLAKAHAQGTIMSIQYGEASFGKTASSFYSSSAASATSSTSEEAVESPLTRLLANAFLTLSFLLFVATFLAFAVARRSRYRESRSSRSRRLLDDEVSGDHESRSRRSRRSGKYREEGDGVFRSSGGSRSRSRSRPRSADRRSGSSSSYRKHRGSSSSYRESSSRRSKRRSKSYDPPKESRRSSSEDYY